MIRTGLELGMDIAVTTQNTKPKSNVNIERGKMPLPLINASKLELEVQHAMLRSCLNSHRVSPQSAD